MSFLRHLWASITGRVLVNLIREDGSCFYDYTKYSTVAFNWYANTNFGKIRLNRDGTVTMLLPCSNPITRWTIVL